MTLLRELAALLIFPGGAFVLLLGLAYEWLHRKLLARMQNRVGPRWFQPLADVVKLLSKEQILPEGVHRGLLIGLPLVALAGGLTAALYVPLGGLAPVYSFPGDLVVTLYLLSLLSICLALAGANTLSRFALVGASRSLRETGSSTQKPARYFPPPATNPVPHAPAFSPQTDPAAASPPPAAHAPAASASATNRRCSRRPPHRN